MIIDFQNGSGIPILHSTNAPIGDPGKLVSSGQEIVQKVSFDYSL